MLLEALLILAPLVGVGAPVVAAKRKRGQGDGAGDSAPQLQGLPPVVAPPQPEPTAPPAAPPSPPLAPPAMQQPPAPRVPPKPDMVPTLVASGVAAASAWLKATPLAPAGVVLGAVGNLFASWFTDAELAKVAQKALTDSKLAALAQANYEGFWACWNAGLEAWGQGAYATAQAYFDGATAAGESAKRATGAELFQKERALYRAWMAKGWSFPKSADGHLNDGWQLGKGNFTGIPAFCVEQFDAEHDGALYLRDESTGTLYRLHWRQGHPDYEGTPVSLGISLEAAIRQSEARRARDDARRVALEVSTEVNLDNKRQGGKAAVDDFGLDVPLSTSKLSPVERLAQLPPAPLQPKPPVVAAPQLPPPAPLPTPPAPVTPPAPKPTPLPKAPIPGDGLPKGKGNGWEYLGAEEAF